MIASRRSKAAASNPNLKEVPPPREPSIVAWARKAAGTDGRVDGTLMLVGGADLLHFRLRVAQSHVRGDMRPSCWSHVGVLRQMGQRVVLYEVPLDPPGGFRGMPETNGVQAISVTRYEDPKRFPNVAVLRFPVDPAEIPRAIDRVRDERGMLDLGALILPWLGFAWGVGLPTNPLLGGNGIPSAAFVEAVFAAVGVELTPGLATRSSCPEAIWLAAKWWHNYYAAQAAEPAATEAAGAAAPPATPMGFYWLGQRAAAVTANGPDAATLRTKRRR